MFGRSAAVFYTDALWFGAVGHSSAFWTRLVTIGTVRLITGGAGAALILLNLWYVLRQLGPVHLRRRYGNLEIAEQVPRTYLVTGAVLISALAGWWLSTLQFGGNAAVALLAWLRSDTWGVTDPLFGRDLSFYIFGLPIYFRLLEFLLIVTLWSILLVGIGYALVGAVRVRGTRWEIDERPRMHFAILLAALLIIFGMRYLLGRYDLLLNGGGFENSIGYTDVHARLPARLVLALLSFALAGTLLYGASRRSWLPPAVALGVFLFAALGMGVVYPAIVQKVQVEPNQLAREARYIGWNMEFTRRAYGLDDIDRRQFRYRRADAATWAALLPALRQLPLWDASQLQTLFDEIETRRRYYQFPDLDQDRYGPPGNRQQVVIGVREFTAEGLPASSRTWQTLHLNPAFTRGLGVVVTPPAQKTANGDPVYWLADLPPVQRHPAAPPQLELREPSIFFGESLSSYVVVGHAGRFAAGVDEENGAALVPTPRVETGVPLSSFARVLAFALRFSEQNLLFARELGDTSRLLFRRNVRERVQTLVPFLLWDTDAQPVVSDGRVVWILDGYTYSMNFPLSRRPGSADLGELRYLRSAVKATVDAASGAVAFYVIGQPDPILRAYRRIFPELFQEEQAMPADLRAHLRYPGLLFRAQAEILGRYQMQRPESFYAGQDVWELPREFSLQQRARTRPPFITTPMPGEAQTEFLLIAPFIARERQNLTGLLIARSDPPNYGQLVLLDMPREAQIKGPAQVLSIIEQDPVISQRLALWRQQGSTAERGQLRMVPTDSSILYVMPLFLSAQEIGIPQLQQVIVTDGAAVAMEPQLESAVAALLGGAIAAAAPADSAAAPAVAVDVRADEWTRRALELMREADARLRAGDFAGFGNAWNRLRTLLEERSASTPPR